MTDDARIRQIARQTIDGPVGHLQKQIDTLNGSASPFATSSSVNMLRKQVQELESKPGFGIGDLTQWNKAAIAHQVEYFSMQAVKVDLDGLALTDEGLTLFGAKIGNSPLKSITQKLIDAGWEKFAGRFQGRFARMVVSQLAPESMHQARRDAEQDEKLLLAKASLGGRISILAEHVARLAEFGASEAARGAGSATARSERRLQTRSSRAASRREAADLRSDATDLNAVRSAAEGLTRVLI